MNAPHAHGTILRERYQLTNIVGQGGMGCVYRAEDLRLPGRLTAVKEIKMELGDSAETREQARQQFLREASILAQLDHPNLPKVSDFFSDEDRDYLVMDYVPGRDLKQLIDEAVRKNELLDEMQVLDWATQLVDALSYLHSQKTPVLHRDIKPSNIKLTPEGRIKLVDFGLVQLVAPDDRTVTVLQGRGTVLYTPLEQYGNDSGHSSVRSDIYSLGATLYHLFTLQAPPMAKERFLNPRQYKAVNERNPAVSQHVSNAIKWAMSMHPEDRPTSVDQFADTLFGRTKQPIPTSTAVGETNLLAAIQDNQWLLALALALFAIAVIITIL